MYMVRSTNTIWLVVPLEERETGNRTHSEFMVSHGTTILGVLIMSHKGGFNSNFKDS